MVFKKLSALGGKVFGGGNSSDENTEIVSRALNFHGLEEYRETTVEVDRILEAIDSAPTRLQKREHEELLSRFICRQDALRSAAVVLASQLDANDAPETYKNFSITEKDRSKVSSGITDPRQCPAHELARYFIEEAQNDFIMGRT